MSDFFNNGSNSEEQNNSGSYSYKKEEINQGESFYQWSPYDDGNRVKKKKTSTLGKKLGNAAAIALVFGLVAGLAFQSIVAVTNRLWNLEEAKQPAIESTVETETADKKVESTDTAKGTTTATKITTDVSEIAQNVLPAIVQVTNVGIKEYQTFFGTMQQPTQSAGSGIIVSQDDDNIYIATNNHVVSGAETLTITFNDDQAVEGTIKGTDSSCDLAVVSVAVKDIPSDTLSNIKVATLGDSDNTVVGEAAIVIGNAMGYGTSVTNGIISAKDREVSVQDEDGNVVTNSLIQTNAAVNPGNSGGALLNAKGEVIGIVSVKLAQENVEGMGYAIPISFATSIIQQMVDNDVVSELDASYLGIAGKDITQEMSEQYNVPVGVYVAQVVSGSGADEAGIEVEDVITGFNGRKVTSVNTLNNIMQYIAAGTTVDVTVARHDNDYKEETIKVTLTRKIDKVQ
ncbi:MULTISPECIES: S1C family serine protease [Pseudobutyrivibrio]|uniref:Serine protease Do n=1 Tax=Pseudobutyrivibrio xylanivorans TaxID=185007 RepID=A0A1G5S052_PSEXY|nr:MULTISPECIES: trypsin-like peptidase domain-containing protein [Pseudobutyrivibrio]MDC7278729.1 trypsin-like peptidase domain-containing protein [Butyrivibrio fibrisolvens]SCZ79752.1 serine protease Do [Pseudobutyrivibrio xylanivorans]